MFRRIRRTGVYMARIEFNTNKVKCRHRKELRAYQADSVRNKVRPRVQIGGSAPNRQFKLLILLYRWFLKKRIGKTRFI